MKATTLLKCIESKREYSDGEVKKATYKNDHTPNNHVKGKNSHEVHNFDAGSKQDNTNITQVVGPKSKESRDIGGVKKNAKTFEADASKIKQTIKGIGQDPMTGQNAISVYDIKRQAVITVPIPDEKQFNLVVQGLNSGNDHQATQAYIALIKSPLAKTRRMEGQKRNSSNRIVENIADSVKRSIKKIDPRTKSITFYNANKNVYVTAPFDTAEQFAQVVAGIKSGNDQQARRSYQALMKNPRGVAVSQGREQGYAAGTQHQTRPSSVSSQGGTNVYSKGAGDIDWEGVNQMSLADSKGAQMESGGVRGDSMTTPKHDTKPFISKSAKVRSTTPYDKKPKVDIKTPKKKEKRSMTDNPAPVQNVKGGVNVHKKMGVHEGLKELESLLGKKINITLS